MSPSIHNYFSLHQRALSQPAMPDVDQTYDIASSLTSEMLANLHVEALGRLKRVVDAALITGPLNLPPLTGSITITASQASDANLAASIPVASSNHIVNPVIRDQMAFYGGRGPTIVAGTFLANPVVTIPPTGSGTNGNLSVVAGASNGNVSAKDSQWTWSAETHVDGGSIEFAVWLNSSRSLFVLVNDQYVGDRVTGISGPNTGSATTFIKVTGLPSGARVRLLMPSDTLAGNLTYLLGVRLASGGSMWKPSSTVTMAVAGDSYSIGYGPLAAGNTQNVSTIANAPWPLVMGDHLGIRDVRQFGFISTGYLATANGASGTARDLVEIWKAQAPFDLIVSGHGYNDRDIGGSSPAAVDALRAEVFAWLAAVRAFSSAPIVMLGSQQGKRGNYDPRTLAVEDAVQLAVQQFADPLVRFAPVARAAPPFITGTGREGAVAGDGTADYLIGTDGIHPNRRGAMTIGARAAAAVRQAIQSMPS